MNRAVLWDLDGTLVDSAEYHWLAWQSTMREEGLAITRAQFLDSFGQKNDRILRRWLGDDTTSEKIRSVGDAKEAEYRRLAESGGLVPLPGALEWVTRLHADGWKQAVASSAPRLNVALVMRLIQMEPYFDALISAEDVHVGKPAPDVFLTAASRLHVDPSRCIVVEDAAAGIEAARRAAMKCIGVSTTSALSGDVNVSTLIDLQPDVFDVLVPDHT
jgi:HAD superfamily hydrolase (TIGR01509 family)